MDNFKTINDTKGHAFGDQVLIKTASSLKQSIRNSDTVARIGGDEFVILLEKIRDSNDISKMVVTLSRELNNTYIINGEEFEVRCSIGVAIYPDDGTTTDTLLAAADKAMYKSKHKRSDA